jgi:hypothetical protein
MILDCRLWTDNCKSNTPFTICNLKFETVGAAFPDLPVPGVVPGSLLALGLSKGSKVSRDTECFP